MADKAEDTPRKEIPPTKASVNLTIGEDWGDNTNYGSLIFCQLTLCTTFEHQHAFSWSGGHIKPTWVLLYNHSTMDVFSNKRLLKNIRKSDRSLAIFFGTSQNMEQYGSTQWASPTLCSSQKWKINTGCTTTEPKKTSYIYTCQEAKSGLLHTARGVSSTLTWMQGKWLSSILYIIISLIILNTTTLGIY